MARCVEGGSLSRAFVISMEPGGYLVNFGTEWRGTGGREAGEFLHWVERASLSGRELLHVCHFNGDRGDLVYFWY